MKPNNPLGASRSYTAPANALRDQLATAAMQAILGARPSQDKDFVAKEAYTMADAMLEQRNQ